MDEVSVIVGLLVEIGDLGLRFARDGCGDPEVITAHHRRLSSLLPETVHASGIVFRVMEERPLWRPEFVVRMLLLAMQNQNKTECLSFQLFQFDGSGEVERTVAEVIGQRWPAWRVKALDFRSSTGLRAEAFRCVLDAVNGSHCVCRVPNHIFLAFDGTNYQPWLVGQKSSHLRNPPSMPPMRITSEVQSDSLLQLATQNTAYAKRLFEKHKIPLQFIVDNKERRRLQRFIDDLILDARTRALGHDLQSAKTFLLQDPTVRAEMQAGGGFSASKRTREEPAAQTLEGAEAVLKRFKFTVEGVLIPRERIAMEDFAIILESRGQRVEAADLRDAVSTVLGNHTPVTTYRNFGARPSPTLTYDAPPPTEARKTEWAKEMWMGYSIEQISKWRPEDVVSETIHRHEEGTVHQRAMLSAAKFLMWDRNGEAFPESPDGSIAQFMALTQ